MSDLKEIPLQSTFFLGGGEGGVSEWSSPVSVKFCDVNISGGGEHCLVSAFYFVSREHCLLFEIMCS